MPSDIRIIGIVGFNCIIIPINMNLYYLTAYGSSTWNRTTKSSLEEMHYIRLIMEPDEEGVGFEPTDL